MCFIVIKCDKPVKPDHGDVKSPKQFPEYNDVVEYSCDENYTLVGNRFLTCGDDWDYDFPPPKCKG